MIITSTIGSSLSSEFWSFFLVPTVYIKICHYTTNLMRKCFRPNKRGTWKEKSGQGLTSNIIFVSGSDRVVV